MTAQVLVHPATVRLMSTAAFIDMVRAWGFRLASTRRGNLALVRRPHG